MINGDYFNSFEEYEQYINNVSRFWTLYRTIFPELKQIKSPSVLDLTMADIVNDVSSLKQHINLLEILKEHNTNDFRNKYIKILEKLTSMKMDFI